MKKLSFVAILLLVVLAFCGCNSKPVDTFMSEKDYAKVTKDGNPLMTMDFEYKINNKTVVLSVNYELLMDKCPITVVNFLNNAHAGLYKNTTVSSYVTKPNYVIAGRYTYDETNVRYNAIESDHTIKGEFSGNGYSEPNGGYQPVSLLSLAMYHESDIEKFDTASTAFMVALNSSNKVSEKNFAVFAKFVSLTYTVKGTDGAEDVVRYNNATEVPAEVLENFKKLSSSKTQTYYYTGEDGNEATSTTTMLSNVITVSIVKLTDKNGAELSDKYFDNLPKNYVLPL